MNRWTAIALALLAVALAGVWLKLRTSERTSSTAVSPAPEIPSAPPAVSPRPAGGDVEVVVQPIVLGSPPSDAGTGAYDDAHLYRHGGSPQRFPSTPQGVLWAFERSRDVAAGCFESARQSNPALTSLVTVEVRIAAQDDGSAAIEEVRLPDSNDPALAFRGCLVAALVDQRFELPEAGFVRHTLAVDLSRSSP